MASGIISREELNIVLRNIDKKRMKREKKVKEVNKHKECKFAS